METSVFGRGETYAGRLAQDTAEAYEETGIIDMEPSHGVYDTDSGERNACLLGDQNRDSRFGKQPV